MGRSVVLAGTERCGGCQLPPRWCVCDGPGPVSSPLQVDILLHRREQYRPTSTGRLIQRVVPGTRTHVFRRDLSDGARSLVATDRSLWILHPRGEPLASVVAGQPDPARTQVLLLDGSWSEAAEMSRAVESCGRLVSLPLTGESRYALREQQSDVRQSTVEALLGVLEALSLTDAARQLRLHFELHVWATLRARGKKLQAAEYLATSPIRDALPDLLARLLERRPNPAPPKQRSTDGADLRRGTAEDTCEHERPLPSS